MTKPIRLTREARAEVSDAARWYERQRPELRRAFLAAIDDALARMVRLSSHLAPVPEIDPALAVKRVFVERFPYAVYFRDLPTRFRVLAIAHARRQPFYWRDRL